MAVAQVAAVVVTALAAVAVQAVAMVAVVVTAAKPQRSNINTAVLLREQQGVN